MALDKFINNVRAEVAKRFDLNTDAEIDAFFIGIEESAKDNQESLEKRDKMLRDTVAELCEAKRLLKAATGIIKDVDCNEDYLCDECEYRAKCDGGFSFYWRYADEAFALIGEDGEQNG